MPVAARQLPTPDILHQWFEYCHDGHLLWKKKTRGVRSQLAQDNASRTCKYRKTTVPGHGRFLTHRVIWEMHNGPVPHGMWVDHINRDKLDNRIENLRLVTWADNQRNTHAKNKTGLPKHVFKSRTGRYSVIVRVGTFDTIEEAERVALDASAALQQHEAAAYVGFP